MAPPTRRWFRWLIVPLACVLGYFAILVYPPSVSATLVSENDGNLRLRIKKNFKVNGILGVSAYSAGQQQQPIWSVAYNYAQEAAIVLHADGPDDKSRMVRRIMPGEEIIVDVNYQFDSAIPPAACATNQTFRFKIAANGTPEYLGQIR